MTSKSNTITNFGFPFLSIGRFGNDGTTALANQRLQYIEFFHLPSGRNVAFKGALTTFTDNFMADWNQNYVFGRMDSIATYKRTTRNINIGFSVQSADENEAANSLERMSLLTQMMYPAFDAGNQNNNKSKGLAPNGTMTLRGGPLVKIRFMNWVGNSSVGSKGSLGLLGWMANVSFAPDLTVGVFQHQNLRKAMRPIIYPKKFDVSFVFNVLHEEMVGWNHNDQDNGGEVGGLVKKAFTPKAPYGMDIGDPLTLTTRKYHLKNQESKARSENEALDKVQKAARDTMTNNKKPYGGDLGNQRK
tara:strand:- start:4009 stop:4917 length:909 start_codon:yes stop_codon:yes gene_type:complete